MAATVRSAVSADYDAPHPETGFDSDNGDLGYHSITEKEFENRRSDCSTEETENGRSSCSQKDFGNRQSDCTLEEAENRRSDCTPDETEKGRSDCTPEETEKGRSDCTPEETEKGRSDCTPEETEKGRSDCTPEETEKGRSDCTPEETEKGRSDCTPEETEKGRSDCTPEETEKGRSDCTPEETINRPSECGQKVWFRVPSSPLITSSDSPRRGGYTSLPFTRQSSGPEKNLEEILLDANSTTQSPLKALVFEFPEGLPDRFRAAVWLRLLGADRDSRSNPGGLNEFLVSGKLDEINQNVIRSDVERTRAHIDYFRVKECRKVMEQLLTYFCKAQKIKYKQGLNEVLAPFVYLRSSSFDLNQIYQCFSVFINKFLLVFSDDEFTTLQCSFCLFTHLLKYHDPALAYFLEHHGISPELYVTPWFLTIFASKLQINHLLCLWDFYIAEGDRFFFCFFALALLLHHRQSCFSTEISALPETLTHIGVKSYEELRKIWHSAKQLKRWTPSSFAVRMSIAQGNSVTSTQSLLQQTLQQLSDENAFHILPQEVLRHCYGLHLNDVQSRTTRSWKVLVFDIRTKQQFESGRLPPAVHLDLSDAHWPKRVLELTKSIGSVSLKRSNTKENRLKASQTEIDQNENGSPIDDEDESFRYHICIMSADSTPPQIRLANYVHSILTQEMALKWISVVRGGFKDAHQLALQLGLELVDHQEQTCSICTPQEPPKVKKSGTGLFTSFRRSSSTQRAAPTQPSQRPSSKTAPPVVLSPSRGRAVCNAEVQQKLPESSGPLTPSERGTRRRSSSPVNLITRYKSVAAQGDVTPKNTSANSTCNETGQLSSQFAKLGASKPAHKVNTHRVAFDNEEDPTPKSPGTSSRFLGRATSLRFPPPGRWIRSLSPNPCPNDVPDSNNSKPSNTPNSLRRSETSSFKPSASSVTQSNNTSEAKTTDCSSDNHSEDSSTQMSNLFSIPHFLSLPGPSFVSPYTICKIESEHWKLLRKRFQRFGWPDVIEPNKMCPFVCWIESLKLDETSKRALVDASLESATEGSGTNRSVTSNAEKNDASTEGSSIFRRAETQRWFGRLDTLGVGKAKAEPKRSKTLSGSKPDDDIEIQTNAVTLSAIENISEVSFFVPDTRACYLVVAREELAVTSMPYSQASQLQRQATFEHLQRQNTVSSQASVFSGSNTSPTPLSNSPPTGSSAFALVYARRLISEFIQCVPKKGSPNTFLFYFDGDSADPEMSIRFRDEPTARQCISRIEGLRAMNRILKSTS